MDLTESIQPRSDQINADDLIAGPMSVTVREVIKGAAEQPFDFLLAETDRAYRPSKTMRRVIVNAWGSDAANYAGRRLTLYREPSIMFGGQKVGGIRISHMSHIAGPLEVMAQTMRGKREKFTVQPLPNAAPADPEAERSIGTTQTAAETAGAATPGGLTINSTDDAARVIHAMTIDQVRALKTLIGSNATSKSVLARELYDQRAGHPAEAVLLELA